ncbi:MAG: Cu(I)/Ag(I) efflux system membrane fusion protein [Saprospiraceae bacterium]|jgi:Cu(I)/Ag(I) efflux system membrane fusion protein
MNNYKLYIIGALLLIGGLAIGWFVKPTTADNQTAVHDHSQMNSDESPANEEIWTCSMHPQIRQNEPGICPICEMDLILLDNSLGSDDPTILRMSKESAKLAQIETFVVGGNIENQNSEVKGGSTSIKVDGTVQLDERTIKSQTAHLSGRIETMAVTFEGQYVTKGQKIASLFSTELLAASQELITAAQFNDRVEGLKEAAIQKLKNWKITDTQIQEILSTRKPIETITIYADQSGYVLIKKLSQGDYVKQGQALYTLGSTSSVWLIFDVFESDLANVRKGSKVVFTTPSVPNKKFEAKVTYIDPLMNSSSRTATVRAEINNSGNQLKPGLLLNGVITSLKSTPAKGVKTPVIVPNTAVLWTGERSVVFIQLPDLEVPTYQYREVELGNRSGEYTNVVSGLDNGEEVVTHGAFAVDAAAQLNNNMSMMNKNVKVKKDEQGDIVPSFSESTPTGFKAQLEESIVKYIDLKNALVDTDSNGASLAADLFSKSLKDIDMTLIKGDAHIYWMEQLKGLDSHAGKIIKSEDVEDQRNQFDFLSQAMINSVKAFGTDEKTYYVQYCPMAKDNQGADWISTEKLIRNPYFGDKMMKCGSVKLELN